MRPAHAAEFARAILENCDRHHAGEIDRATWAAEQGRLWDAAYAARVADAVVRLVAPPAGYPDAGDRGPGC